MGNKLAVFCKGKFLSPERPVLVPHVIFLLRICWRKQASPNSAVSILGAASV